MLLKLTETRCHAPAARHVTLGEEKESFRLFPYVLGSGTAPHVDQDNDGELAELHIK